MNAGYVILLVSLCCGILVAFVLYFLAKRASENNPDVLAVPFFRVFPAETPYGQYRVAVICLAVLDALFSIGVALGYILLTAGFSWWTGAFLAIAVLKGGLLVALFLVHPQYTKAHLGIFVGYLCAVAFFLGVAGLQLLYFRPYFDSDVGVYCLLGVMVLLAAVTLYQGLSPRLRDWARLEKVEDGNGKVKLVRGENFTLPGAEWRLLLLDGLGNAVFGLVSLICYMLI